MQWSYHLRSTILATTSKFKMAVEIGVFRLIREARYTLIMIIYNINGLPTATMECLKQTMCSAVHLCTYITQFTSNIKQLLIANRPIVPTYFSYLYGKFRQNLRQTSQMIPSKPILIQTFVIGNTRNKHHRTLWKCIG